MLLCWHLAIFNVSSCSQSDSQSWLGVREDRANTCWFFSEFKEKGWICWQEWEEIHFYTLIVELIDVIFPEGSLALSISVKIPVWSENSTSENVSWRSYKDTSLETLIEILSWAVCFSGSSVILQSERLPFWFSVKACAWVMGLVPHRGTYEKWLINVSLPVFIPPFPSL